MSRFPPEATEARSGVPAAAVRGLMRDLAAADGAAVYGRTGSCLGRFGTLVAFLIDALNLLTGNLDRPGGAVFGHSALMIEEVASGSGRTTYARRRSRIGAFPDVLESLPAPLLAQEITTPGKGQGRALIVGAGSPVLSVPNGMALERALGELELLVVPLRRWSAKSSTPGGSRHLFPPCRGSQGKSCKPASGPLRHNPGAAPPRVL